MAKARKSIRKKQTKSARAVRAASTGDIRSVGVVATEILERYGQKRHLVATDILERYRQRRRRSFTTADVASDFDIPATRAAAFISILLIKGVIESSGVKGSDGSSQWTVS